MCFVGICVLTMAALNPHCWQRSMVRSIGHRWNGPVVMCDDQIIHLERELRAARSARTQRPAARAATAATTKAKTMIVKRQAAVHTTGPPTQKSRKVKHQRVNLGYTLPKVTLQRQQLDDVGSLLY